MGEAKRNKARLGEWYGKPITAGHPDAPTPKASPTIPIAAPQRHVPERVEHKTANEQNRDGVPQRTPAVSNERIVGIDHAMPGSDRIVMAVYRPNQSPTFRRANRNAGIAVCALLGMVGVMGSVPNLAETIGGPDGDKKDKS